MTPVDGPDDDRYGRGRGHWHFRREPVHFDDFEDCPADTRVLSPRRDDANWQRLAALVELEEITAIAPSAQQIEMITGLPGLKRLRLWDVRKTRLPGIERLEQLEELALFNVSGPRDLAQIADLPNLRALLIRNMPSLEDFSDLSGARGLACLCVEGGREKPQVVRSLDFLGDLGALDHLLLSGFRCLDEFPILKGLRRGRTVRCLAINPNYLTLDDLAYLHSHFSGVDLFWPESIQVGGEGGVAWSLEAVETLEGDVLTFWPCYKGGRPYTGPREEVLKRVRSFLADYEAAMVRVGAMPD